MNTYEFEYTDTFNGEANYSWCRRGTVNMPELTHYGYDGATNYVHANRYFERELMRRVKKQLGLSNVQGRKYLHNEFIEFRPCGMNTVLFINYPEG